MFVDNDDEVEVYVYISLWGVVCIIFIVDLVMSLDNVIVVVVVVNSVFEGLCVLLLVVGLGLFILLIIFGSMLLLKVM